MWSRHKSRLTQRGQSVCQPSGGLRPSGAAAKAQCKLAARACQGGACHPAAGRARYAAHQLLPGPCGGLPPAARGSGTQAAGRSCHAPPGAAQGTASPEGFPNPPCHRPRSSSHPGAAPAASAREAGRPPGIRAPAPGGGRRGLLPGSACHPAAGRAGYAAHELPPGPSWLHIHNDRCNGHGTPYEDNSLILKR